MPKTLVLFYSRGGRSAALADAIVEGARSVRFAEVDVRRLDELAGAHAIEADPEWSASRSVLAARYRTLEGIERLADYDAIVLGGPTHQDTLPAELARVLDEAAAMHGHALLDRVGSAFTSTGAESGGERTPWPILAAMGRLGMILVPSAPADAPAEGAAPSDADLEAARRLGRRVATVADWVRHAKGHAHGHGHAHDHGHSHAHPHSH
jgi:NAD(P)H dehydrogenase (quinone)